MAKKSSLICALKVRLIVYGMQLFHVAAFLGYAFWVNISSVGLVKVSILSSVRGGVNFWTGRGLGWRLPPIFLK